MERKDAEDPRLPAGISLLGRTGAKSVQVRYHDDEEPTLWMAYAEWPHGQDCGAGMTPGEAVMRLCDQVMDGGTCAHCGRPSGVTDHWESEMPLAEVVCWYVFDPETGTFRRSCEGETTGRKFTMDPETGQPVGRNDPCPCGSGLKYKRCHGR